jgi:hypothetical protein
VILGAAAASEHGFDGHGGGEERGAKTSVILTKKLRSKSTNLYKVVEWKWNLRFLNNLYLGSKVMVS